MANQIYFQTSVEVNLAFYHQHQHFQGNWHRRAGWLDFVELAASFAHIAVVADAAERHSVAASS